MSVSLRRLLTISGGVEALGGVLTLIDPDVVIDVLLGGPADNIAIVFTRFFGAGMFALGIACVRAREYVTSPAGLAIVYSITSYNVLAAVLILWAAASLSLGGLLLKAAGLGHAVIGLLFVRGLMVLSAELSKFNA
ncbi:MAG TPA: hypothetical protein VLA99_17825 [Nitrospiraceae bacterium]|nr:hypothetical protein [Nitrospiraceae bacterium]